MDYLTHCEPGFVFNPPTLWPLHSSETNMAPENWWLEYYLESQGFKGKVA